jgi:uncharacterized protein (TIGR02996 family)
MTPDDFLREIIADPDNDAPRLIYADWLEELGDPRAEFIRVQCELMRNSLPKKKRIALKNRESALLLDHKWKWIGALEPFADQWTFRRGFIEGCHMTAVNFLQHGEQLFQKTPLRLLWICPMNRKTSQVAQSPLLGRLAQLNLRGNRISDATRSMLVKRLGDRVLF